MLANWVKETVDSAPGTGTIDLGGAVAGFVAFATMFTTAETVRYMIEDGDDREVGIGTFTNAATDTLSRDTILETLDATVYDNSAPTAISLTASAVVFIAAEANALYPSPLGKNNADRVTSAHHSYDQSPVNSNMTADKQYAAPFLILHPVTYTKMGVSLQTGNDTSTTNIGICRMAENGVSESSFITQVAIATTTTQSGTCTEGTVASTTLMPGWYMFHILSDTGMAFGAMNNYAVGSYPFPKQGATNRATPAPCLFKASIAGSPTLASPETITSVPSDPGGCIKFYLGT